MHTKGVSSMCILLAMDVFQRPLYGILWHIPERRGWNAPVPGVIESVVASIVHSPAVTIPLFFAIGLWGPLYTMKWGRDSWERE